MESSRNCPKNKVNGEFQKKMSSPRVYIEVDDTEDGPPVILLDSSPEPSIVEVIVDPECGGDGLDNVVEELGDGGIESDSKALSLKSNVGSETRKGLPDGSCVEGTVVISDSCEPLGNKEELGVGGIESDSKCSSLKSKVGERGSDSPRVRGDVGSETQKGFCGDVLDNEEEVGDGGIESDLKCLSLKSNVGDRGLDSETRKGLLDGSCVEGTVVIPDSYECLRNKEELANGGIESDSKNESSKLKVGGRGSDFQRRMSPRLHRDVGSETRKGLSDGSSIEGTENKEELGKGGIESGSKSSSLKTKVGSRDSGFQRRMSPRLHEDVGSGVQKGLSDGSCVSVGSGNGVDVVSKCEVERRLSPRLHPNSVTKVQGNTSREWRFNPRLPSEREDEKQKVVVKTPMQRKVSPRIQSKQGNEMSKTLAETTPLQRRLSPRFHSVQDNEKQKVLLETLMQRRLSPRIHGEQEYGKKKPLAENASMQGTLSLRHHNDQENEKQKALLETPMQKRVSPRIHGEQENEKKTTPVETTSMQRRLSPRLQSEKKNENQKTLLDASVGEKRLLNGSHLNECSAKRRKHDHCNDGNGKVDFECSYVNEITCASNDKVPHQLTTALKAWEDKAKEQDEAPDVAGRKDSARVKETLRIFNTYYLQSAKEEEERRKQNDINEVNKKETLFCKKEEVRCTQSEIGKKKKKKTSKSKDKNVKQISCRPDLKAISKMRQRNEILYPEKTIGHLPGIDVGYQFYSRAEMVAIGFHSHWLNGIDYIGECKGKKRVEFAEYTLPIAVAVVLSGLYEDDLDDADSIIYTGEGGHDLLGSKLQCADQALVRGNLALKNSMDHSVPIRVIRGHKCADSYSGKLYSYDGLYKVVNTWADKGCRGHLVYKYCLERLKGQPKLTTDQVQFIRGRPLKSVSELPGLVCRDISQGLEDYCIPVTNIIDDPPVCPPGFTYITSLEVAESVKLPPNAAGCSCKGNCTNPNTCACAKLNGSDFPYVQCDGGRLVEAKDIVFECGPNCGCKSGCLNRISQRGLKYRLEVYRTPDKGWGVRSWDFIPSGSPVCEYIGVLSRSDELDNIAGNEYIFEIDCWHTINEIEGRERRFGNIPVSSAVVFPKIDKKTLDGTPEFCIDAGSRGNVARFINHSCEPNLFVQCILSAHHDLRLARVVLIAADNILPMQELSYDYGFPLDSVIGPDGKVKVLPCFCGTGDCRKRLY